MWLDRVEMEDVLCEEVIGSPEEGRFNRDIPRRLSTPPPSFESV